MEDSRLLASGINEFLRNQEATRNDKTPLARPERPAILDDPKAHPATVEQARTQFAEEEQRYGDALISRKNLTRDESRYLAGEVSRCLREEQ